MTGRIRWLAVAVLFLLVACGTTPDAPDDSNSPTSTPPTAGAFPDNAGQLFVDSTDIVLMESFPVQVALRVTGSLPTPCHTPVWDVNDDGSTIAVRLGSITDGDAACIQVLEPVELSIPLGSFESGSRIVTLNGEEIGDFEV